MVMNYVPKHSRDHAYSKVYQKSEMYQNVGVDRKVGEFVGNKQIHCLSHSHTDTHLYIHRVHKKVSQKFLCHNFQYCLHISIKFGM